jgi:hypothetical protein
MAKQVNLDEEYDIRDAVAFPILTEQVDLTNGSPSVSTVPGGGGPGGSSPLGAVVNQALRDVLGYKVKRGDVKGFLNALNQSFQLIDDEGHTDFKWIQRSYASGVDADMGAVTGAQASILTRAQVAVNQCLPLIDGLYPLDTEVMQQDIDAIKSIVSSELQELVSELGIVGGPRVHRVNEIFGLLMREPTDIEGAHVRRRKGIGHIAMLGDRLGFERVRINTVDEEQNFTNFMILKDYVSGLKQSWDQYKPYFARLSSKVEPFLGTNLVLISRALTAVAETVNEALFAMDSVFIGPEERQTLQLNYAGGVSATIPWVIGDLNQPPNPTSAPYTYPYTFANDAAAMFVSELTDWTLQAVTDQAQDLIQNAGKDGVIALYPTLDQLRRLIRGAMVARHPYKGGQQYGDLPSGYFTDRVQLALQSVASELDEAAKLCGQIYVREEKPRERLDIEDVLEALRDPLVRTEIKKML